MNIELSFVARALEAEIIMPGGAPVSGGFTGVCNDSRMLTPGDLFVALRGENGDGHRYLGAAAAGGAAAVMAQRDAGDFPLLNVPVIKVADTLAALQQLAARWREQFAGPLIAVTGSVGKTGAKDMLAACLQALGPVHKTPGNYNNEIGLPLTLLELEPSHRSAVVEMGMRAPGEISALAAIARPKYAVITNVEPVHLETMHTLENIARAKTEVLEYIGPDGFAVLNGDQELLLAAAARYKVKQYRFGWHEDCEIRIEQVRAEAEGLTVQLDLWGETALFTLPLPMPELAYNMAAAAGTARLLGVSTAAIKRALATVTFSKLRTQVMALPEGGVIINDTYNAGPTSMKAALGMLNIIGGQRRKVAVLGDMLELGGYEQAGHREVGARLAALDIPILLTIGPRAAAIGQGAIQAGMDPAAVHSFNDAGAGLTWMREHLSRQDAVLFKASRGMRLEALLEDWLTPVSAEGKA